MVKVYVFESKVTSKLYRIPAKSFNKALETLYFKYGVSTNNMSFVCIGA